MDAGGDGGGGTGRVDERVDRELVGRSAGGRATVGGAEVAMRAVARIGSGSLTTISVAPKARASGVTRSDGSGARDRGRASRPSTSALRIAAMPTDNGSHSAAASSDMSRVSGGRTPRRWSRTRRTPRRPAGWRRTACAGTGCSARAGTRRCRDRAVAVRWTPADRRATGRTVRRPRRSCPPPRVRGPGALPPRSRPSGRAGSSAYPTRRRRPRHPTSTSPGCGRRHRPLLHLDPTRLDEHAGSHPGIRRKCCVGHTHHVSVMSNYSHP